MGGCIELAGGVSGPQMARWVHEGEPDCLGTVYVPWPSRQARLSKVCDLLFEGISTRLCLEGARWVVSEG